MRLQGTNDKSDNGAEEETSSETAEEGRSVGGWCCTPAGLRVWGERGGTGLVSSSPGELGMSIIAGMGEAALVISLPEAF